MAASIHPLFPGGAANAATAEARAAAEQHPLVVALRDATLKVLKDSLRALFERADDLLFEMGEKAGSDSERRRYFDTMRVLRLKSARVTQTFTEAFADGFIPVTRSQSSNLQAFDIERLAIQPTEELEQRIAIDNLANKAEGLFKHALWEVEQRLAIAAREFAVPVAPQALNPARICEAFGVAIGELDTEFQIKLVIYKLLDRSVLRDFERVYAIALDILDRNGIDHAQRGTARAQAPAPSRGADTQAANPVDLVEMLRRIGMDPAPAKQVSPTSATELGRLLQSLLIGTSTPVQQASAERLTLANQLLQELLSEPLLPPSLRPTIENLRVPLFRSALTDAAFFADNNHPLRVLLADLVETGVAAQTGSPEAQPRLQELLRRAAKLGVAASGLDSGSDLRSDSVTAERFGADEAERFLEQLRQQTHARREAMLMRVRRQISQELEIQTLGRDVPAQVMHLLRSGIGPLMAMRLLRNGRSSGTFAAAQDLLERILNSLDYIPPPTPFELQARDELMTTIADALAGVGMDDTKLAALLEGLREAYALLDGKLGELSAVESQLLQRDFDAPPATEPLPSVTVMELLARLLTPESWYRVYDADQNQTRWLKLTSFHPSQDSILFSGFDETNTLRLRALRFASDLAQGYSEPINPSQPARDALEQLRAAKARGLL